MDKTIWKYAIPIQGRFEVEMPAGADVLSVQVQHDEPQIWAAVDPGSPRVTYGFYIHGTGHPINPKAGRFIGTFQTNGGRLVWHLFEEAL
jgi:hypothetical protein